MNIFHFFCNGNNDGHLSSTIVFANKSPQQTISIFGGGQCYIQFCNCSVAIYLTVKIKCSFLDLFLKFQTTCDNPSCSAFTSTIAPQLFTKLSTQQYLKTLVWHLCFTPFGRLLVPSLHVMLVDFSGCQIATNDRSIRPTYSLQNLSPTYFQSICAYSWILVAHEVLMRRQHESQLMSSHRTSQGRKILKKGWIGCATWSQDGVGCQLCSSLFFCAIIPLAFSS